MWSGSISRYGKEELKGPNTSVRTRLLQHFNFQCESDFGDSTHEIPKPWGQWIFGKPYRGWCFVIPEINEQVSMKKSGPVQKNLRLPLSFPTGCFIIMLPDLWWNKLSYFQDDLVLRVKKCNTQTKGRSHNGFLIKGRGSVLGSSQPLSTLTSNMLKIFSLCKWPAQIFTHLPFHRHWNDIGEND